MTTIPSIINNTTDKPLLSTPESNDTLKREPLAYIDAYDAVLDCDYAFLAYKETDVDRNEWKVRIQSSKTTGVVFDPPMMRDKARSTAAQGKPWFTWGAGFEPSESDPRHIEYRVHQTNGKPSAIEIYVAMRAFGGGAGEPQSVKFDWPA